MIIVDAAVCDIARRSRTLRLSHVAAGLTRGLEPGESVLLPDGEDFVAAWVDDLEFELEDTVYHLRLGATVPAAQAFAMVAGERSPVTPGEAARRVDTGDVVALLAALREAGTAPHVPSQRRIAELLAER